MTDKAVNAFAQNVYPVLLSLAMPVFLYNIVMEREYKLLMYMKINGMQMQFYWIVNYFCNFVYFTCSALIYYIFGRWIAGLTLFSETQPVILGLLFIGWGLCQISLAFTYSSFFEKQQSAQVVGYILSVVCACVFTGISMTEGHLDTDRTMFWWLRLHPLPCYCRVLYKLTEQCAWFECISSFDQVTPELWTCLRCLYINAVAYFFLGVYLEKVMPTANGIPQHPLFFIEKPIKDYLPSFYRLLFVDEEQLVELIKGELVGEDQDVVDERTIVDCLTKS
jgi:hypothetical protein